MSDVEKFRCDQCGKLYQTRAILNRHVKCVHEKIFEVSCEFCDKKFAQPAYLKFHIAHKHGVSVDISSKIINVNFECPICSVCFAKEDIPDHLLKQHDVAIKSYVKEFDNLDDFKKWRDDFEETTKSKYNKPYGGKRSVDGSMVHFYSCRRSDYYSKRGNRKSNMTSGKDICHCPAEIKAIEAADGKVTAYIIETHLGHDDRDTRLRLPKRKTVDKANEIAQKVPLNDNRNNICDSRQRSSQITRQDLENMGFQFDSMPETINKDKIHPKIIDLRKKHKNAVEQGLLTVKVIAAQYEGMLDQWCVRSSNGTVMYDVVPTNINCNCKIFCSICKFCIHAFKCSCPDNTVSLNMCEHIHTIGIEILKESDENLPDIDDFLTASNNSFLIDDDDDQDNGGMMINNGRRQEGESLTLEERILAIKKCCERIGNNISRNEEVVTYLEKSLFPIEGVKLAMETSLQGKLSKQESPKKRKMEGRKRISSSKKTRTGKLVSEESGSDPRLALYLLRESP